MELMTFVLEAQVPFIEDLTSTNKGAAKRKNSVSASFANKRVQLAAAASNYEAANPPSQVVKIAPTGKRFMRPRGSAVQIVQPHSTTKPAYPATATVHDSLPEVSQRYVNIAPKLPLFPAPQIHKATEPSASSLRTIVKRGPSPVTNDRRKGSSSSSSSTTIPAQIPHQPTPEYVQIHERYDAEATGADTLQGKIAFTRNRDTWRMLVEAQGEIRKDLEVDQQRCQSYISNEYKHICDEDMPYLQKLKRKKLDDVWGGRRYKANLDLLDRYLILADKIYGGMRDNMAACMSRNALQQSAFSMRLQAFGTKVEQVKAVHATLEDTSKGRHLSASV